MNIVTAYELAQISVQQVIIYLRKSRAEKNETVEEVLARHERILQDFAEENFGDKVPESNIYREVVSGETLDERIEIKKIFSRLEKEDIKVLLVVEPQRVSRGDMLDCGRVVRILEYTNTLVSTITKTYNLSNKFDKEIFEAQLLQGNKYLEYHKEIMDRGKALSLREGKYVGSTPPFGYNRKQLDRGFMLVKHKEEAPIVETIFNLFVDENLSTLEIAGYLNKHQMKPKKAKLWNDDMVRHVLKNEVYYGSLAWGKRPIIKQLINGEIVKIRASAKDYMLVRGRQEPIITKEKWDMAQEKIKGNPSSHVGHSRELQNPLAGLVFCKKCGYSLVRIKNRKSKNDARKPIRKYKLDKLAIRDLLRDAKKSKSISYQEIADFLDVSRHIVISWFETRDDRLRYTEIFSEKWYELKFLLEIDTTKYDKQILTYADPRPLNDTFMCSNPNCDMVSCVLQKLEKTILDKLKEHLQYFNHFVDNYEEEIIKERRDTVKAIMKINTKLEGLRTELKNLRRAYNREEFTYEEYLEDKQDIDEEIKVLTEQLNELQQDSEEDTLLRYKKAIPILSECLNEYNNWTIEQKNEGLKSIIERITYSKTKRLNWRKNEEDDMTIHIELKL